MPLEQPVMRMVLDISFSANRVEATLGVVAAQSAAVFRDCHRLPRSHPCAGRNGRPAVTDT